MAGPRSSYRGNTGSNTYDSAVAEFLEEYQQPALQEQLSKLAFQAAGRCEDLLQRLGVKGIVTSRLKQVESLKTKLQEPDSSDTGFRASVSKGELIANHPDMGDLVGIRIGLYYPTDCLNVATEINKVFEVEHLFGTVSGGRDAMQQGGNKNIQEHRNGPWRSRDIDGDDECWEHSGYKSWQIVVSMKPLGDLPPGSDPTPGGLPLQSPSSAGDPSRPQHQRQHRPQARMAPTMSIASYLPHVSAGSFDSARSFKFYRIRRVEIQVGTVITQAWAEVQHNIIYKKSAKVLATPTMKRMIDAINGLAITTEIILDELARSSEQAEREAKQAEANEQLPDWTRSGYQRARTVGGFTVGRREPPTPYIYRYRAEILAKRLREDCQD